MDHMKSASIRDLRYRFPEIERLLGAGETIEITRRGRPVGRLSPPPKRAKAKPPDIMARLQAIYGGKVLKPSNAALLRRERDERW